MRLRESSCGDSHPNPNRGCNLLICLGSGVRPIGFVITPLTVGGKVGGWEEYSRQSLGMPLVLDGIIIERK